MGEASTRVGALVAIFLTLACATPEAPRSAPDGMPLVGRILDTQKSVFLDEGDLLDQLAGARFVLLGERHDRPEHHRLQARILRELAARGRRPVVAFEMLRADEAAALERATGALEATPQSIRTAVAWDTNGWPDFALYEPVFAAALDADMPMAVADLPVHALGRVSHGGLAGVDPGSRSMLMLDEGVPAALREALAEDVVAGHCGHLPERVVPIMVDVQLTRDANMARAMQVAADSGGDGAVLIAGAKHARSDWGVPWWLRRREPGASVLSLAFADAPPEQREPGPEAREHDLVWYTSTEDREDPCEKYREQLEALRKRKAP